MLKEILLKLLDVFRYALFIRIIIDYIRMFARSWRPNSFLISIFEIIYTITDKPMAFVRRFIPPLRLGGISLDLSIIVLIFAINIASNVINLLL